MLLYGAATAVQGVADVRIVGGQVRELTVELRPEAMAAAGVSAGEIVGALEAQNLAAPVGRVNAELSEQSIRLLGRLDTPQEFEQLAVATRNGQVVRLGQLATVRDGAEEQRTLALFDGVEAVGIEVLKSKGYSTTAVADQVKARARELEARLPRGANLEVVQDSGERVSRSVREVETTLLEGALLTILVVFLFLNSWRSTVITGLALPVSVLAAFISVWAFGFTLNMMSLLGLSLAIGIFIVWPDLQMPAISRFIVLRNNVSYNNPTGSTWFGPPAQENDELKYPPYSGLNNIPYGFDFGGCQTYGDITFEGNYVQNILFFDICPYWEGSVYYPTNLSFINNFIIRGEADVPQALLRAAGVQNFPQTLLDAAGVE